MTDDSRLENVKARTSTKPPLTAIINKPNACKQMNHNFQVIPWGATVAVNNCQIRLLNTCPLDNFLMALNFICSKRTHDVDNLQNSLPNLLEVVNNLITDKRFADAKYRWLQSLAISPQVINSEIYIFGNEHDNVIVNCSNCLKTSFSGNCFNRSCMQPVINFESTDCEVPCLPKDNIAVHEQQYFVECVGTWNSNNTVSICNRILSNSSNSCDGVRSRTRRQFVNGAPLLLPFNLDQVVRNGMIHTMSVLPDKLKMDMAGYELVAVTYGNGQHFISSLKIGQVVSKNC